MIDERDDRLDEMLRDAARDYNAPPPTPRAEMWQRIQVARSATALTPLRRSAPWKIPLTVAAILLLGIAIGRLTTPGAPKGQDGDPIAGPAALSTPIRDRGDLAARLVTTDHLGQAESFLTEFGTDPGVTDFSAEAKALLANTRLLLDSKRIGDPATRQLLEDLELVLVQIATLDPSDRREELGFISAGLAHHHLQARLRNASPPERVIRM